MFLRLMPLLMIGIEMTNLSNVLLRIQLACGNASRQLLTYAGDLASAALVVAVAALVAVLPIAVALFVQPSRQCLPCRPP